MNARDEILRRVRGALAGDSGAEIPAVQRTYVHQGTLESGQLIDLLVDRLLDHRALVRRCAPDDLVATVAAALSARGARRVVVPAGLDLQMPPDVSAVLDEGQLSAIDLDGFDGVVTRVAVAIAQTGTLVLDGSRGQGRRAITLVPDYHLCVVRAEQLVETVPEAIARLASQRPMTWVSGPSATSDIELSRVEGVHGPRTLEVVLVA